MYRIIALLSLVALNCVAADTPDSEKANTQVPVNKVAPAAAATPAPPVAASPTPPATPISLESSYRREFALLQTQKEELQSRLRTFKAQAETAEKNLQQKISTLGQSNVSLAAKEDSLHDQLSKAEQSNTAGQDNNDLLEMTYSQANASLSNYQRSYEKDTAFINGNTEQKLSLLYQGGALLIQELAQSNQQDSVFFLQNGKETQGKIIHIGNIAAYGVSDAGSGILVPAGEGKMKLWSQPAADTAQALLAGQTPALQKIYLFENKDKAVAERKDKTFLEEVAEGGEIAWIILGLGVLSILLIIARLLSLIWAAYGRKGVIEQTVELLSQARHDEALHYCQKRRGPFARILTAVIGNAHANPKHMDDVIEESLLRESGALNRFGAPIVVIASLAPLVGLLGTVTGMIATFGLITEHGTGDPRLLSSGIAIALVATELGLAVAIPAGLAGSLLGSWSESLKSNLEEIALRASNILLDQQYPQKLGKPETEQTASMSL